MAVEMSLSGQTAIVAGAGRGIGAAVAVTLADAGATVAVVERLSERADETVERILARGGSAFPVLADLTDPAQIRSIVPAVVARTGRVDVLVNVAGGSWAFVPYRRLHEVPDEDWALVHDINLTYVFRLTKDVLRHLVESGRGGAIVHVTSIAGAFSSPNAAAYGAAKAATISLTKSLAQEYGPDGIRINSVAPGRIATPATQSAAGSAGDVDFTPSIPLRSMGSPQHVADAVLFLACDRSGYITGQTVLVDGGASSTPALVPAGGTSLPETDVAGDQA